MANTTSTTLSNLYTNILQTSMYVAQERAAIRPLVMEYNVIASDGKTVQIPIYDRVTTDSITSGENTDATAQAITPSVVTIQTDEIAVMTTLTDTARQSASDDVAASIGRLFGETLARKVDESLVALFSGFSNKVSAHGDEVSVDDIFNAVKILRNNHVYGPYVGVFSPAAAYSLKKQLANTQQGNIGDLSNAGNQALSQGIIGTIAGVTIYESALVGAPAGDSSTAATNAIMTPEALGIAIKKDITIETQRDASLRAEEIVASMTYGVKEIFDDRGVAILSSN